MSKATTLPALSTGVTPPLGTTEVPVSLGCPWISTLACQGILRGVLMIKEGSSNLSVRLGIESTINGITVSTPVSIGGDSGSVTVQGTAGQKFYNFDPNSTAPNNGSIGLASKFRVVALCKSADASPAWGVVSFTHGQMA